jgi:hypothetical protein
MFHRWIKKPRIGLYESVSTLVKNLAKSPKMYQDQFVSKPFDATAATGAQRPGRSECLVIRCIDIFEATVNLATKEIKRL